MLEYVLHREIFHYKPPDNSKLFITLHFLLHGVHHKVKSNFQSLNLFGYKENEKMTIKSTYENNFKSHNDFIFCSIGAI